MSKLSKTIDSFSGQYDFLSNFYMHEVDYEGKRYPSTEHAYQAAKSLDPAEREKVRKARSAGHSKKLGRKINLRTDWESVKVDVMRTVVREKFKSARLKQLLLDTGKAKLVEGNHWGDTYWGVCKGRGKNWLGKVLMEVRKELSVANDAFVNAVLKMDSPEEKLERIRDVLFPIAKRFYNDAPDMIEVPKSEMAALHVLVINNKNWK